MLLEEYDKFVRSTAVFPAEFSIIYPTLGLVGEAGEVAEKIKKSIRGDYIVDEVRDQLILELGDVMWYNSALAQALGSSLEKVMEANVEKLSSRKKRDKIQGNGDER